MLKLDPISLREEIDASIRVRDNILTSSRSMVRDYVGKHYRSDWKPDGPVHENHAFEWMQLVLPQIVFDNPQVRVDSGASGVSRAVPAALEAGLNWWIPQVELFHELYAVAQDAAFCFGVTLTDYEESPGGEPYRDEDAATVYAGLPRVRRVSPERWFCDATADRYRPEKGDGRYAGHLWRADKDDLLADDRYNAAAINAIAADADLKQWEKIDDSRPPTSRNEIMAWDIWVPEADVEDPDDTGLPINGGIFTLATALNANGDAVESQWIRDPRPYFGPASGPYTLFGYATVSVCPYPLSPFAATYEQVRNLNEHEESLEHGIRSAKKIVAVDSDNDQAANVVRKSKHGDVVKIRDLSDKVKDLELGGPIEGAAEYNQKLRDRRDRATGLSDEARGNVDGQASATAVADAASQRNIRTAGFKRLFADGARSVLNKAAWFMFHHETAVFPLPPDVAEEFVPRPHGLPDPSMAGQIAMETGANEMEVREALEFSPKVFFAGGPSRDFLTTAPSIGPTGKLETIYLVSPNVNDMRIEDFVLSIEPYSMERTDEALLQRRTLEVQQRFMAMLPSILQYPMLPWEDIIDMMGQPLNMRNLSQQLLGRQLIAQLRQAREAPAMAMPGAVPAQAGGVAPPANHQAPSAMDAAQQRGSELASAHTV